MAISILCCLQSDVLDVHNRHLHSLFKNRMCWCATSLIPDVRTWRYIFLLLLYITFSHIAVTMLFLQPACLLSPSLLIKCIKSTCVAPVCCKIGFCTGIMSKQHWPMELKHYTKTVTASQLLAFISEHISTSDDSLISPKTSDWPISTAGIMNSSSACPLKPCFILRRVKNIFKNCNCHHCYKHLLILASKINQIKHSNTC